MKFKMRLKINEVQAACIIEGLKLLHDTWDQTPLSDSWDKDEVFDACKDLGMKMKEQHERMKR